MKFNTLKPLQPYRRKLRKSMTPAEVALWQMIRRKQLNNERFLRQYSIGNYVVDFYCPKHKLAIELDGEVHLYQQEYDDRRTEYLNSLGVTVIRFENSDVFNYSTRVLEEIEKYLK